MSSLEKEIVDIVRKQLGLSDDEGASEISLEHRFIEDLKADSLDLTELVLTLEDQFGCEIPDEDAEKLKTIRDAVLYIESKKQKNLEK
jgi:acyl carrier protein